MEFNIKRIWHLARRDFALFGLMEVALFGTIAAMGFISRRLDIFDNMFLITCIFTILFIARGAFSEYKKKLSRLSAVLLPASNLEKYIYQVAKYFIVCPIIIFASSLFGIFLGEVIFFDDFVYTERFLKFLDPATYEGRFWDWFLIGGAFVSIFFYFALFFKRQSTLKVLGLMALYIMICMITVFELSKNKLFDYAATVEGSANPTIQQDAINSATYSSFLAIGIIIFFVILGFFRLKEERIV